MTWSRAKLGMAMLLLSESVLFLMLIVAFIYFRDAAVVLTMGVAGAATAFLVASAVAVRRASRAATIVLGTAFLACQGVEYFHLLRRGVTISQGLFGTTFFTLTGMHALHVLIGILLLAIVPPAASDAVALYWNFGVVVWIAIFSVVYLWTLV